MSSPLGKVYRLARIIWGAAAGADTGTQLGSPHTPSGAATGAYVMTIPAGSVVSNVFWNLPTGAVLPTSAASAATVAVDLASGDSLIPAIVPVDALGNFSSSEATTVGLVGAAATTITYTIGAADITAGALDIYGTVTPQSTGVGQGA